MTKFPQACIELTIGQAVYTQEFGQCLWHPPKRTLAPLAVVAVLYFERELLSCAFPLISKQEELAAHQPTTGAGVPNLQPLPRGQPVLKWSQCLMIGSFSGRAENAENVLLTILELQEASLGIQKVLPNFKGKVGLALMMPKIAHLPSFLSMRCDAVINSLKICPPHVFSILNV